MLTIPSILPSAVWSANGNRIPALILATGSSSVFTDDPRVRLGLGPIAVSKGSVGRATVSIRQPKHFSVRRISSSHCTLTSIISHAVDCAIFGSNRLDRAHNHKSVCMYVHGSISLFTHRFGRGGHKINA